MNLSQWLDQDTSIVEIPATNSPLSDTPLGILSATIDPEARSTNQGIRRYVCTNSFLNLLFNAE